MDNFESSDFRDDSADDATTDAQFERLEQARRLNDQRLKSRFEHLFAKYGRDFSDVGDEIDLRTGEIVVNNGHLESMQNEVDPGTSASSRFVKTFKEDLEHEDDEDDEDSSGDSDGFNSDGSLSDEEEDELAVDTRDDVHILGSGGGSKRKPALKVEDLDKEEDISSPFRSMARPAPRLAQLLIGQTVDQPIDLTEGMDESSSVNDESASSRQTSSNRTNINLLKQVPHIQESITALASRSQRNPGVDDSTIQALGASIANQLASLMSLNPNRKQKKRKWRRGADPLWDYPEIDPMPKRPSKRVRQSDTAMPVVHHTSPNGSRSLWAPQGLRGRPRKNFESTHAHQDIDRHETSEANNDDDENDDTNDDTGLFVEQSYPDETVSCAKCGREGSPAMRLGSDGENLCDICHDSDQILRHVPQPSGANPATDAHETDDLETVANDDDQQLQSAYSANTSRRLLGQPKSSYTIEEEALIIKLREREKLSWEKIAGRLQGRTVNALMVRYHNRLRHQSSEARKILNAEPHGETPQLEPAQEQQSTPGSQWTEANDQLLLKLHNELGLDWASIATRFPGQTIHTVQERYRSMEEEPENALKRDGVAGVTQANEGGTSEVPPPKSYSRFGEAEDALLVQLREVEKLNWCDIIPRFPGRSEFSLRTRYKRHLSPRARRQKAARAELNASLVDERPVEVSNSPDDQPESDSDTRYFRRYEEHEDTLIMKLKKADGLSWDQIAEQLPGRRPESIKNRYEYMNSKRADEHVYTASMSVRPQKPDATMGEQLAAQQLSRRNPAREHVQNIYTPHGFPNQSSVSMLPFVGPPGGMYLSHHLHNPVPPFVPFHDGLPVQPHSENAAQAESIDEDGESRRQKPKNWKPNYFSPYEDALIVELRDVHAKSFEDISKYLPGRAVATVAGRYRKILRPNATRRRIPCDRSLLASPANVLRWSPKRIQVGSVSGFHAMSAFAPPASIETLPPPPPPLPMHVNRPSLLPTDLFEYSETRPKMPAGAVFAPVNIEDPNLDPLLRQTAQRALPPGLRGSRDQHTQQPRPTHRDRPIVIPGEKRSDAPLLRKALDNNLRRQSGSLSSAALKSTQATSSYHGSSTSPILIDDATPGETPRSGPSAISVALSDQESQDLVGSYLTSDFQESDQDFGHGRSQELMKAIIDSLLSHGKPQWAVKTKQIYDKNPSDGRLEMLFDVFSIEFVDPMQRLQLFDNILSNAPLEDEVPHENHVSKISHRPSQQLSKAPERSQQGDSSQRSRFEERLPGPKATQKIKNSKSASALSPEQALDLDGPFPHDEGDDELVEVVEAAPGDDVIPGKAHNSVEKSGVAVPDDSLSKLEKDQASLATVASRRQGENQRASNIDHPNSRSTGEASLRLSGRLTVTKSPQPTRGVPSRTPHEISSPSIVSGPGKDKAGVRSSPLDDKVLRRKPIPEVPDTDIIRNEDTTQSSPNLRPPDTPKRPGVSRQSSGRTSPSKDTSDGPVTKVSAAVNKRRRPAARARLTVPDSEASEDEWTAQESSDTESTHSETSSDDESDASPERHFIQPERTPKQALIGMKHITALSGTHTDADGLTGSSQSSLRLNQSESNHNSSPNLTSQPLRHAMGQMPSTPGAAAPISGPLPMTLSFQTPAPRSSTPRISASHRLAQLKNQQHITPLRASTPTNIVVHRSVASIRSLDRSEGRRVVETPMREIDPDNSEDELA